MGLTGMVNARWLVSVPRRTDSGSGGPGNPIGGLVFSKAFTGQFTQLHEWSVRLVPSVRRLTTHSNGEMIRTSFPRRSSVSADARTARALLRYASISTT